MKRTNRLLPIQLGISAISTAVVCMSSIPKAAAVVPSDWKGTWNCNLDGRTTQITFKTHYNLVVGDIGAKTSILTQRSFDPSIDPPTPRKDHVLPLTFKGEDYNSQDKWFLMLHTWDHGYASGFTRWNGDVYGIQCRRQ